MPWTRDLSQVVGRLRSPPEWHDSLRTQCVQTGSRCPPYRHEARTGRPRPVDGSSPTPPVIDRLTRAVNDHDLDAMVGCFAPAYRNETPVHPARGFEGREQVRRNWTRILAAIPDVTVAITRVAVVGDTVWTEQEHRGTRPDGSSHVMRGVVIFGVAEDVISCARFYMEPVSDDATTVDEEVAVAQLDLSYDVFVRAGITCACRGRRSREEALVRKQSDRRAVSKPCQGRTRTPSQRREVT